MKMYHEYNSEEHRLSDLIKWGRKVREVSLDDSVIFSCKGIIAAQRNQDAEMEDVYWEDLAIAISRLADEGGK